MGLWDAWSCSEPTRESYVWMWPSVSDSVSSIACHCNDLAFTVLSVWILSVWCYGSKPQGWLKHVWVWITACLRVSRNEWMHVVCSYWWHSTQWSTSQMPLDALTGDSMCKIPKSQKEMFYCLVKPESFFSLISSPNANWVQKLKGQT